MFTESAPIEAAAAEPQQRVLADFAPPLDSARMCRQPDWAATFDAGFGDPWSIRIAGVPPAFDLRAFCRMCADPAARRVRAPRRSVTRRRGDSGGDDGDDGGGDEPPPLLIAARSAEALVEGGSL